MNKHLLTTVLLLALSLAATAQNKRVAILETIDKENKVPYAVEVMVRSNLTKVISNTPGYEGYDRVNLSEIMDEHDFERTGLVNESQIKRLGEIAGADYLLVSEAVQFDEANIFVTAKILNVETAMTEGSENALMGMSASDIQHGCESLANRLLGLPDPIANNTTPQEKPTPKQAQKQEEKPTEQPMVSETIKVEKPVISPEQNHNKEYITKEKKTYYQNGKSISKSFYVNLLKTNCPQAYSNYKKGVGLQTAGWIMLGVGALAGTSISIGDFHIGSTYGMITGGALILGSIPMFIIGSNKKKSALNIYNQYCAQPQAKLSVGPTANGIGICLSF